MSRITRCSHCLTTIYSDASHCHSCGGALQRSSRRGLVGRGGWIFILAVVGLFAVGDSVRLLNEKRNSYHRDVEGMRSARAFVQAFLRGDTDTTEDLLVHDLLRSPKALQKTVERAAAAIAPLLPVDAVELLEIRPAGTVTQHPHYSKPNRTLHRHPARRYFFETRVLKADAIHVIRGQVCVNGMSGAQRILCFRLDTVEHHGAAGSWTAALEAPEIEHLRPRSDYPLNHEPSPVAGR